MGKFSNYMVDFPATFEYRISKHGILVSPPRISIYIYIYVTYLDIPCHMISYMITHVISYASKIYAHYTYMHYITLHIIYCALHYSTLHYSTLHVYITTYWLVVSTPLKILVSWEYYFQHMGK